MTTQRHPDSPGSTLPGARPVGRSPESLFNSLAASESKLQGLIRAKTRARPAQATVAGAEAERHGDRRSESASGSPATESSPVTSHCGLLSATRTA